MHEFDELRSRLSTSLYNTQQYASRIRDHEIGNVHTPIVAPGYKVGSFFNSDWIRGAVPHMHIRDYGGVLEYTDNIVSFVQEAYDRAIAALQISEDAFTKEQQALHEELQVAIQAIISGSGNADALSDLARENQQAENFLGKVAQGYLASLGSVSARFSGAYTALNAQERKPHSGIFPNNREHMFACMGASELVNEMDHAVGILEGLLEACDQATNEDTQLEYATEE